MSIVHSSGIRVNKPCLLATRVAGFMTVSDCAYRVSECPRSSSWCGSRYDNEIVSVFASKGQLHRLTLAYNVLLHAACAARSMERSLEHLSETTVAAFAVFAVG